MVRARVLYEQTAADLPGLQAQGRSALYQLAALTGDTPDALPRRVEGCRQPPLLRRPIPVGDAAALLARRPDVRRAERQLAAAVARIGVAAADLYPSITIGASAGSGATAVDKLATRKAVSFSLGPVLSWSFPNTTVARALVLAADARARGALTDFDGSVLTALREAETALVTLARRLDTEAALRRARDDAALARRNLRRLYAGGVGEFLDVLDAERTLISAESALANATVQVAQDQIALFMALGGGWQDAPPVDAAGLAPVTAVRGAADAAGR